MTSYRNFKQELLKDKEIKKAYDSLGAEFKLIEDTIEKGIKKKH